MKTLDKLKAVAVAVFEKLKDTARAVLAWMRTDGIIHDLLCYSVFLTLAPFIGVAWARWITVALALGKEAFDVFVQKDNDWREALHDLTCDAAGILQAEMTVALWPAC